MKIYTKTGDAGETGLWGGLRVRKDAARIKAYGNVDELNAVLGIVRAGALPDGLDPLLERIQNELFVLGSDLATPGDSARIPRIQESYITQLEQEIDVFEAELEPLKNFILPGGTLGAAQLHLARTICRRVERNIITLAGLEEINPFVLPYVNRLSDWLFVLARVANARAGVPDVAWHNPVTATAEA